jgi:hypothetical protein
MFINHKIILLWYIRIIINQEKINIYILLYLVDLQVEGIILQDKKLSIIISIIITIILINKKRYKKYVVKQSLILQK